MTGRKISQTLPLPKFILMELVFDELVTVTFTLFAVIDIIGSVSILVSLKQKHG